MFHNDLAFLLKIIFSSLTALETYHIRIRNKKVPESVIVCCLMY